MQLTLGQVTDKISELKSRAAIMRTLAFHLKAYYKASDKTPAEGQIMREDGAYVHPDHIDIVIADLVDMVDEALIEIMHYEKMTVVVPMEHDDDEVKEELVVSAAPADELDDGVEDEDEEGPVNDELDDESDDDDEELDEEEEPEPEPEAGTGPKKKSKKVNNGARGEDSARAEAGKD